MQVKDLMNSHVVKLAPETSVLAAAKLLSRYNLGSMPVCSTDGKLRGIVTDRDIVLRCVAQGYEPETTPVKELMTRRVYSVTPEDDVREATRLMAAEQVRRLPVTRDGRVVGMLSLGDMAKTTHFNTEASKALYEISSPLKRR